MNYEMREHTVEGVPPPHNSYMAAFTPDGHYIGDEDWARTLADRGIAPTVREGQTEVCSIGFCEAEQKWYGWSHRAMHGFGVGSRVEKGDCAYQPKDGRGEWTAQTLEDAKQMACDYAEGVG